MLDEKSDPGKACDYQDGTIQIDTTSNSNHAQALRYLNKFLMLNREPELKFTLLEDDRVRLDGINSDNPEIEKLRIPKFITDFANKTEWGQISSWQNFQISVRQSTITLLTEM